MLAMRLFQRGAIEGRIQHSVSRDRRVESRVVRDMYHERFELVVDSLNVQFKSIRDHVNEILAKATQIRNIVTTVEDSTKIDLFDLNQIIETSKAPEMYFEFDNFQLVYEDQYVVDFCGGIFPHSPSSHSSSRQPTEDGP